MSWYDEHETSEGRDTLFTLQHANEPLLVLRALSARITQLDTLMFQAVADCRRQGHTWSEVARALGVSRQAAQARFAETREKGLRKVGD
ncbi:MAG TPA: hypothetical protein VFK76_06660 [Gaiellaceae bacterium]|nr:hypothetical protein [Gaiellaceae bacterium]